MIGRLAFTGALAVLLVAVTPGSFDLERGYDGAAAAREGGGGGEGGADPQGSKESRFSTTNLRGWSGRGGPVNLDNFLDDLERGARDARRGLGTFGRDLKDAFGRNGVFQSDIRLKRDVRHLATLGNGLRLYSFRYRGGDTVRVGVMAQDLLADGRYRHAVMRMGDGYYAVNYRMLGLEMITLDEWRARRAAGR